MANNVSLLDSADAAQVFKTTQTTGVHVGHINVDALPAVANSGVFVVQENGAALTAQQALANFVATPGSPVPSRASLIGGSDGANARLVAVTAGGLLKVDDGGGSLTVDGSVSVTGSVGVTGPLTDVQLRATAVPISGALTDVQLRAAAVPVAAPGSLNELSSTLTRLANTTIYSTNALIAPNAAANAGNALTLSGAVLAAGDGFRVERCLLGKSTNGATSPVFRVFLWRALPTFTGLGDNGVLGSITSLVVDDITKLIDYFDITMDRFGSTAAAGAAGVGLPASGVPVLAKPASGTTLYWSLQSLSAYAPGSGEIFTPRFEGQRA